MMFHAYLFEARGIQRFLFASGKLRDMLGGSELLDYVCAKDGLLDQTLKALQLQPEEPRKAGGAFYLLFDKQSDAQRFRAAWRLSCSSWIPGVEQVDVLCAGNTAREAVSNGLKQLSEARNRITAELPSAGPLSERSPRTGLAANAFYKSESLDQATLVQRRFHRPEETGSLEQRFLNEPGFVWPNDFENTTPDSRRFPLNERRLVGLIHADGNGLGELLRKLSEACRQTNDEDYINIYRTFSDGLSWATQQAANEACKETLFPQQEDAGNVLPARPLVLGGDDVTIIVRADLALDFTRKFLKAFEEHTRSSMSQLCKTLEDAGLKEAADQLPAHLTACAGISYMKCSQPFYAGHELAEGLCKRAKSESRDYMEKHQLTTMPASVAFHKVQDSLLDDEADQYARDHKITHENQTWALSLPVYSIDELPELPSLNTLSELVGLFSSNASTKDEPSINDRPLRELVTLWHTNPALAEQAYTRWRTLALENTPQDLQTFDGLLQQLVGPCEGNLPCSQVNTDQPLAVAKSPINDLLGLLTLNNPKSIKEAEEANQ